MNDVIAPPANLISAREEFLALVATLRPELHRYCARLTGSVIDGEDIVQDTLAKAFYALSFSLDVPPLRPWLFRIAHNTALDFLKSHGRKHTDVRADLADIAGFEDAPDPAIVRAALTRFLALPLLQRSAVILKDVLGHSLEETAETMQTTVMAVKAALVRGRRTLLEASTETAEVPVTTLTDLERYARLFNARDWDGLRALIGDDCRLDLVSKAQRRGPQVGAYLARYEVDARGSAREQNKDAVELRPARVEGRLALAAHLAGSPTPAYFILLEFTASRVTAIRDYRYVPYIAAEALIEPA